MCASGGFGWRKAAQSESNQVRVNRSNLRSKLSYAFRAARCVRPVLYILLATSLSQEARSGGHNGLKLDFSTENSDAQMSGEISATKFEK